MIKNTSMLGEGFKPVTGLPTDPLQANATTIDKRTVEEFADANLQKLALDAQCSGTTLNSQSHTYKTPDNWIYSTGYSAQDVYFYHSDHLGSSSFITTVGGYATQHLQYMAYGEDFIHQQNKSTYKTPYTFSAKEKDNETNFSYFGARYYQADLSIWLSVDPLADKYPSLSPYNYCANNPIMLVDPDGRDVVFAKNSSKEFKKAFAQSVQHLNTKGASGMLAELQKSEKKYFISESVSGSSYNPNTNTIKWAPNEAILTNEFHELSATSILNHEIDHALQHDKFPEQQKVDGVARDPKYVNKEEKRVITGSEQVTAKKLGEIKEGEVTRKDHGGTLYESKGPTSTARKYEIIIKPKKDE